MNLDLPLISIGLVAYNRGNVLPDAIESLLAQSYKHFELIISDDASTDDTEKICKYYSKKDSRIKYIRHKKNIGMANNFNFVLIKAKGEYFMWACDDDVWHKNFIKILISLLLKQKLKQKRVVLAMSNVIEFNNSTKKKSNQFKYFLSKRKSILNYLDSYPLLIYGIFRTKVLQEIGGLHVDNRPLKDWGSDHMTIVKTLLKGEMVYTRKPLLYKRDSGYSLDRNKVLENLSISNDIVYKIKRNLLFPVIFFYDLILSIKYIINSNSYLKEKGITLLYYVKFYIRINWNYLSNCVSGVTSLLSGINKRFLSSVKLLK